MLPLEDERVQAGAHCWQLLLCQVESPGIPGQPVGG